MVRNLGGLMRQLAGNRKNPCLCPCPCPRAGLVHHYRKLLSNSIQTLTLTAPSSSSSHTIDVPSTRKSPRNFWDMPTPSPPPELDPPNLQFVRSYNGYYDVLKQVEDGRISAVFFYTAHKCWPTFKWITPFFHDLCRQYSHITIYKVYMIQNGLGYSTLHKLGVKSPTFHFYLKGEKVDELASASIPRLKKTLANVYNPSGMKKRRPRDKKNKKDEGVDLSQLVEVFPSRFPASSIPKVMEAVESLCGADPDSNLWWFAKGLLLCQDKREMFSNVADPDLKLKWLKSEMDFGIN